MTNTAAPLHTATFALAAAFALALAKIIRTRIVTSHAFRKRAKRIAGKTNVAVSKSAVGCIIVT